MLLIIESQLLGKRKLLPYANAHCTAHSVMTSKLHKHVLSMVLLALTQQCRCTVSIYQLRSALLLTTSSFVVVAAAPPVHCVRLLQL
jgi:hypothetical protein